MGSNLVKCTGMNVYKGGTSLNANEKAITVQNEVVRLERDILLMVSQELRNVLNRINIHRLQGLEEIRLRAERPLMLQDAAGDWFVQGDGTLTRTGEHGYTVRQVELLKTLELMSENSIYAYQEDISSGFITLRGGHRVGITGRVVLEEGHIRNIKDISGLNIRISREVPGCSKPVTQYIVHGNSIYNTLLISPPLCGKTTLLRDIARFLSSGQEKGIFRGVKVGVVDERSEIAACFKGIPQNNLGPRTDVLDACPKALGMVMMLRSMSPHVIVTDEIGNQGDREAVMRVVNAGIKIITTAHGYNISEMKTRREVLELMQDKVFERYIVLSSRNGPGTLEEVVDGTTMSVLYRRDENVS